MVDSDRQFNAFTQLSVDDLDTIYDVLVEFEQRMDTYLSPDQLNDTIEPTPQNRQMLDEIVEQISLFSKDRAHIVAFLDQCHHHTLTPAQQSRVIECQRLCQLQTDNTREVMQWILETKKRFNQSGCPMSSEKNEVNMHDTNKAKGKNKATASAQIASEQKSDATKNQHMMISPTMMKAYFKARASFKKIYSEVVYFDPHKMTDFAGRQLEVQSARVLHLETEHEMNVFMDFCLFEYYQKEKNVVERYYDEHASLYSGYQLALLTAFKHSRFSLLNVVDSVGNDGLVVYDPLLEQELLMIDQGLNQVAKTHRPYFVLTHYLPLSDFYMTTGASTPILSNTRTGEVLQAQCDRLVEKYQYKQSLKTSVCQRIIAKLYKIAIHHDVVKAIDSPVLPMSYAN